MRRTIKAVAGICVLVGTLFLTSSTANAQECGGYFGPPCETDVLEFEYPACVTSGGTFAVEGSVTPADAASAGEDIDFSIDGQAVGSADINDDGTFSTTLTTPSLALGQYSITGVTGELSATGDIDVCDDSNVGNNNNNNGNGNGNANAGNGNNNAAGNGALARTGFDATPMVTLGAAVLILGAAAVYGSKRRNVA